MKPTLTFNDYQRAAKTLKCEVAAIRAVAQVESSGDGFDVFGNLKKRFEPAWFQRLSGKSATSYNAAYKLDPVNAMKATSWGKFQIMGFNHAIIGYASVEAMVEDFEKGEAEHLSGFVKFVQHNSLADELQRKDWKGFAYRYNGENYAVLGYHTKMAAAYAELVKDPEAGLKKKALT